MATQPALDPATAYCRALWVEFCRLVDREPGYTSSSVEFALMFDAYKANIPIRIILRGVQDTLQSKRRPHPKSLLYYRGPIKAAIEYWTKSLS